MKTAVFALAMACATVAIGTPAQAQNYPWCAYWRGTGGSRNCGFISYAQCMETAQGRRRRLQGEHPIQSARGSPLDYDPIQLNRIIV